MKPILALLAASTLLSAGLWSADDEVDLKKEDVPAAVLATMQKAAAGAALDEYERETKKGVVVYTATFDKDKKEMEVTVAADGTLIKVEAEEDEDDDKDEKKHGKDDDDKDEKHKAK